MRTDDYHRNFEAVSSTSIREARHSARKLVEYINERMSEEDEEYKHHFDFGNAFEFYLNDQLHGTTLFADNVVHFTKPVPDKDFRTKANRVARDQAIEDAIKNNKYLLQDGDLDLIKSMFAAVQRNQHAMDLLEFSEYQTEVHWTEHGVQIKSRLDYSCEALNVIVDVKSTRDAKPHMFAKDAANHDYPVQAMTQMNGMLNNGWDKVNAYYWLVVEKSTAGEAVLYEFQPQDWEIAENIYNDTLIKRVKPTLEAIKNGTTDALPGYEHASQNPQGTLPLELPLYYGR